MPKYEAGTEIKYTVGEEAVADYETKRRRLQHHQHS
ncbi:MAG: Cna B-type domain-containing protein [Ruminococcus sp.]